MIGYPYTYGNQVGFWACNNRKQAVSYSILISTIWWHNLKFGESIQSYPSFSNQPKMEIIRKVETYIINSINR